jgi:hypothetical protein
MDQVEPLHPANAEAIAEFAEEAGAEVPRGALRCPPCFSRCLLACGTKIESRVEF